MFVLEKVVPWGRSYSDYLNMFHLTEQDLKGNILGCGDGPSSFNSEMNKRGCQVISCDPLYQLSRKEIQQNIRESYNKILKQASLNMENFIWDTFKTIEELGEDRVKAMNIFLADYDLGKKEKRYLAEGLPDLPFPSKQFDLVLCSHLLFIYTKQLSLDFHINSIKEMCRVAREVRIFPLIDLTLNRSPYVDAVLSEFYRLGIEVKIEKVSYEFHRGGNEMMRIVLEKNKNKS